MSAFCETFHNMDNNGIVCTMIMLENIRTRLRLCTTMDRIIRLRAVEVRNIIIIFRIMSVWLKSNYLRLTLFDRARDLIIWFGNTTIIDQENISNGRIQHF